MEGFLKISVPIVNLPSPGHCDCSTQNARVLDVWSCLFAATMGHANGPGLAREKTENWQRRLWKIPLEASLWKIWQKVVPHNSREECFNYFTCVLSYLMLSLCCKQTCVSLALHRKQKSVWRLSPIEVGLSRNERVNIFSPFSLSGFCWIGAETGV